MKRKTVYSFFAAIAFILIGLLGVFYLADVENSFIYLCEKSDTSIVDVFIKHEIDDSRFDDFYYNQLSDNDKYIYQEIDDCVKDERNVFMFKSNDELDVENIRHVIYAYTNDNPMVYTINPSNAFDCYNFKALGCIFVVMPKINKNVSDKLIEYTVETIIESLPDRYEKDMILEVNNYICNNYSYNKEIENSADIRSMVLTKQGVCLGYSKLMKLCLDKLGFENIIVLGKTEYKLNENDHAWNAVKVDGHWYYVDVTWADQEKNNYISYDYFLVDVNNYYDKHYLDNKFNYDFE